MPPTYLGRGLRHGLGQRCGLCEHLSPAIFKTRNGESGNGNGNGNGERERGTGTGTGTGNGEWGIFKMGNL